MTPGSAPSVGMSLHGRCAPRTPLPARPWGRVAGATSSTLAAGMSIAPGGAHRPTSRRRRLYEDDLMIWASPKRGAGDKISQRGTPGGKAVNRRATAAFLQAESPSATRRCTCRPDPSYRTGVPLESVARGNDHPLRVQPRRRQDDERDGEVGASERHCRHPGPAIPPRRRRCEAGCVLSR